MPSHLGIDIGTTSIKVCVVREGAIFETVKTVHEANTTPSVDHLRSKLFDEQNPRKILEVLDDCLATLAHSLEDISEISVTGQMHGVLLWKRELKETVTDLRITSVFRKLVSNVSNLITWQDQRCDSTFLRSLPPSPSFCKISTGFGIATLCWIQREFDNLEDYNMCGTIMDFITWLLCESDYVMMTSHNANSWGYFDIEQGCWEIEKIRELNLDAALLPKIVPVCHPVGNLKWPLYGMKTSTKIFAALGDMQCSIRATQPLQNEAVIHIGTSSQLSFVTRYKGELMKELIEKYPGVSIVPYIEDHVIVSAASLSGGNVITNFVSNLQSWMTEVGCENIPSKHHLFTKINISATKHTETRDNNSTCLNIVPRIYGERFDPGSQGSVANINTSNCTLGDITYSIYEGIVRNLSEMLPVDVMIKYGIKGVVATGGAFVDNNVLKDIVMETYALKFRHGNDNDDASFGATLLMQSTTDS